ncbi:cyclopropane fatty-acyl-phospholipid synthase-like methyltransferase [Gracilibacillus halotolerans]|uniref:Cyclopropane fatty-acyl-phospholipid synthase-like methyltransferase n=1 Tax=Gracilibacillus halotolerans TaxID=74386 RepID=A0A841RD38_9BACI|nr:class I SAM-dependent methyltransferase [Gracilibacillus halotolerans]MBB6511870.1 cyclopropane fatty-acyl-phospholipid synthase-like methyltransferase [Gracilibacillus halotolerans]
MAYSKLAYIYDNLMEDAPYEEWYNFVNHYIQELNPNGKKLLDLGCGTGKMSIRFTKSGFDVTGVDMSEDMLAYAQAETVSEGESVHFIQQDLRTLEGIHNCDIAVSLCDVVNYITEEDELEQAFTRIATSLSENGLFIFDVHSVNHFEHNMKNQVFSEIYEDLTYIWLCSEGERTGELMHDLTFFLQSDQNNLYERFDETHIQRTFPISTYRELLEKTGFVIHQISADFKPEPILSEESAERIFLVCIKK